MTLNDTLPLGSNKKVLLISTDEAKRKILDQIHKGQDIGFSISASKELEREKAKYEAWVGYTRELLDRVFNTSELSEEFYGGDEIGKGGGAAGTLRQEITNLKEDLSKKLKHLHSILERVELIPVVSYEASEESAALIGIIEQMLRRFHLVVRQLGKRYNKRKPLEVNDEYDVQYLLHALLRILVDDVRPEESTPSYAGGASRMDFLLKAEKTVIEVKIARAGLTDKLIGNQLLEDLGRYKVHPDCRCLLCFIYDPGGFISNPNGLEKDLSQTVDGMAIKLIVAPK